MREEDMTFSARRRVSGSIFLSLCMLVLVTAAAGGRVLHLALSRAEPKADTTVTTPPTVLKLFFTESVKPGLTAVKLTAPDNSVIQLAPLTLGEGKIPPIVAAIKGQVKNGKHKVSWRTAGADGHAISGEYSFTVKASPLPPREPSTKGGR
jgi:methionine-rich copper-binding protein CopC